MTEINFLGLPIATEADVERKAKTIGQYAPEHYSQTVRGTRPSYGTVD
jgi:hypothetical protein